MISENQRPRITTVVVMRDSTAPPDTMFSLVSIVVVRWTRQRVSLDGLVLLGSFEVDLLPDMLEVFAWSDSLTSITGYTPLSEAFGNEHTVDLDNSWTDTGTHRFLKLKKRHYILQYTACIHRDDPTMLTDGRGDKGGIRITRKNLISGRVRMNIICTYDVSFLRTTRLTDSKEGSILVVIVYH